MIDIEAEIAKPGYICRACFRTYERFQKHKASLLDNVEMVLAKIPSIQLPHDHTPCADATISESVPARKRRRIDSSVEQSPPV